MNDLLTETYSEERAVLESVVAEGGAGAERARVLLALIPPFRAFIEDATRRIRAGEAEGAAVIGGVANGLAEIIASLCVFYEIPPATAFPLIEAMLVDVNDRARTRLTSPGMVVFMDGAGRQNLATLEGLYKGKQS